MKSRLWIEVDDKVFLGEGRVRLLKAILKTGSLSKAAKSLGMSYKKAWGLIESINKSSKTPVVETSTGGKGGGGSVLTLFGKNLISVFDEINKGCWEYLETQSHKINKL